MSVDTTKRTPPNRLLALLKTLYQAPAKINLSQSSENKEENNNLKEELSVKNKNESECLIQNEHDKVENSSEIPDSDDKKFVEDAEGSQEKTVNDCLLYDPEAVFDKYMVEEYIEKDGKYYKTNSLEISEETVDEVQTDDCSYSNQPLPDPEIEADAVCDEYMVDEYIEKDGKYVKTSSLEISEETVEEGQTDNSSYYSNESDFEIETEAVFDDYFPETCLEDDEVMSSLERNEETEYWVEADNYLYSDNSLCVAGNMLYDWSQIIRSDEDRNQIYDKWMSELEIWERNRLKWLDEISQSEGFDSSDYKDRTFLIKVDTSPSSSDTILRAENLDTVNVKPVSVQEVEKLKSENVRAKSVVELESLQEPTENMDQWYKAERLRHHKKLYEMGLPNWYEDILQDLSNDNVEVLSVSSDGADYDDSKKVISTTQAEPFHCSASADVVLVYQFTDRHLWRKYHGCWKRSKPVD